MIIPRTKLNLRRSWKLSDARADKKVNRALKRAQRWGESYAEVYFPDNKMKEETALRLRGRLIAAGYEAYQYPHTERGRMFKIYIQKENNND
ncbi:hypothetical protein [Bacillus phage phiAGATE]|uniref:Uncharacterized protein n=1 Tax=Bacillus phage phiAGATE TaxID=1204533 RepID=L0LAF3_9CAUD|nr:hypothetical protein G380_gp062 [Bacillus phage phiAGATE]AGB62712.1 hypothetical protein [Bacillus phage phiAGATE]